LASSGTTNAVYAIYNTLGASGTSNTINIYSNIIRDLNWSTAAGGLLYPIFNTSTAYNLLIYNNEITNISEPNWSL